jgi:hypothetical protein
MTEIFSLIDMKGYTEWQAYRMREEGEEALKLEIEYIKKFHKIHQAGQEKETLLQNNFITENTYSTDNKRAIIDEIFTA